MNYKTVTESLSRWFDKPLSKLPTDLRPVAEAYIKNWSALSAADRRSRAIKVDRQRGLTSRIRLAQVQRKNDQANDDPRQVAEGIIGWYDGRLDADSWSGLSDLAPRKAAFLMCQLDPDDDDGADPTTTNNETGPDDFKRLLRVFEDVAKTEPP